jgi:hypothetical protein
MVGLFCLGVVGGGKLIRKPVFWEDWPPGSASAKAAAGQAAALSGCSGPDSQGEGSFAGEFFGQGDVQAGVITGEF